MRSWDLLVFGLGIWTTTEKKWQKNMIGLLFLFASLVHGVVVTLAHFFQLQYANQNQEKCSPFLLYLGMEIPSTNIVMFVPPLKKWQKI